MPCLIKKASRCVADGTSKTVTFFIFHFLYLFISVFIGSVVKIVLSEAATRGVLYKKVFLKRSQNSQENIYGRVSFLINLQVPLMSFIILT